MDGDIDGFINAYLKAAANGTIGYKEHGENGSGRGCRFATIIGTIKVV